MTRMGHAIVITFCAIALGGLILTAYSQFGPTTEDLNQTNLWFALLSIAGGAAAGAIIWWVPWPFVEIMWHRQLTDRALYLLIVIHTILLGVIYYYVAQKTRLIYPEIGCIAAAVFIYYRNYTVRY